MKLLELPEQTPAEEIDEEILEIFVEEVEEVLGEISGNYVAWKDNPGNEEALTELRRAFHTLKGSGRLVGAMVIGELGWKFENMLNRVIDGTMARNNNVLKLVGQVEHVLPGMIEQFQHGYPAPPDVVLLVSQAHVLTETKGASVGEFEAPDTADAEAAANPDPIPSEETAPPVEPIAEETVANADIPELAELASDDEALPDLPSLEADETADLATELAELDEDLASLDGLPEADLALDDLASVDALEEAADLADPETEFAATLPQDDMDALSGDLADLPELDGLTSDAADDLDLGSLDDDLPDLDADLTAEDLALTEVTNTEFSTDNESLERPELMDSGLADHDELPELETDELLTQDNLLTEDLAVPAAVSAEEDSEEEIDPVLLDIFRNEAAEHITNLKELLDACEVQLPTTLDAEVIRAFHTLNGSSRSVDFQAVSSLAGPLENYARSLVDKNQIISQQELDILRQAVTYIEMILNAESVEAAQQADLLAHVEISDKTSSQAALDTTSEMLAPAASSLSKPKAVTTEPSSGAPIAVEVPDASDEFMVIFLEEADEILENTQSLLERWQVAPDNMQLMKELQRELHTLKGGARMVGIKPMGDLSHKLESILTGIVEGTAKSNAQLPEMVQASVDELASMLEAVRSGEPLYEATQLLEQIERCLGGEAPMSALKASTAVPKPAPEPEPTPPQAAQETTATSEVAPADKPAKADRVEKEDSSGEAGEDRIRVRASLIDKLTNLAGELSISRAHLEQQQGSIKGNIGEMEQTVMRLRDLLRRLEIETEAQIISHYGHAEEDDEEFDPLEMDRFSLLQQLSRSLMETVNDLINIQDSLKMQNRQTDSLLLQQSRIGAELQDGIMRTRMVPFARISPRLQRIARLTSKELRKQVVFNINGEAIEFERTVLNRIVAPLEHMLRNAIGHGVEEAETRQQAGKPAAATINIDLEKESSDLIVRLSDDGGGLNLPAIRKKAEERGLLKPGEIISDQDLMQFILEPAFSTAKEITQVSGRGVGMDVVNSEIKQLSGNLQIFSQRGKGTTFEIRLPLSLTINLALLVHVGEETMAIPLNNVEAVMRAQRSDVLVNELDEAKYYKYMDHDYRVFYVGALLGIAKTPLTDSNLLPILLIRTGERRVALLVDGVEGSKEIVVKAVGPQLGGIRWLAGATILGDGRVVLILDMPMLARAESAKQYEEQLSFIEEAQEEAPPATTIMVVDDSITVRKVTARLLKRQGLEVMTAKDGVDAVAQLQEHIPDLMLLDVEMPRMDGYELATQVRNTETLKHIPIIMITSRTGAKHRDRAEKIGINRYLGKPFNETELLENINELLEESKDAVAV